MNNHSRQKKAEIVGWTRLGVEFANAAELLAKNSPKSDHINRPVDLLCAHALETTLKGLLVFASSTEVVPEDFGHDHSRIWNQIVKLEVAQVEIRKCQKALNLYWKDILRTANDQFGEELSNAGFESEPTQQALGKLTNSDIGNELPEFRDIWEWYGERNGSPHHKFRYPWSGMDYRIVAKVGGVSFDVAQLTAIRSSKFICHSIEAQLRGTN